MASSIAEFRALVYREITLPSGLVVTVQRKPGLTMFLGLGELPQPSNTPEDVDAAPLTTDQVLVMFRYTNRAIAAAVVTPPISDKPLEGIPWDDPDTLHVTELTPDDSAFLAREILQSMGLLREEAQAVDSFRADEIRADHQGAGADVSPAAE